MTPPFQMRGRNFTVSESQAFVKTCDLPPTGSGVLEGLRFAVKDLIDIADQKTGCGNPAWRDSHPEPSAHAVCVEQLLRAGARCVGKTISDELAFSLLGQNHFYGTPLNPAAPERVPGGSSSGSASAVACGLVDFAIGTDTGGSVRVPASNCGILGFRPSHGFISVAGVNPLAPTFDTVGVFARDADILKRVAAALLSNENTDASVPASLYILRDAFNLADEEVQRALEEPVQALYERFGERVCEVTLDGLTGGTEGISFDVMRDTYCVLQWAEIKSCLGAWIADAKPEFGPAISASFALTDQLDRRRIPEAVAKRESFFRCLRTFLKPTDLLCIPTTPALAPRKDIPAPERFPKALNASTYYPRTLSLTSVAGLARLPQISLPWGCSDGVPVGLSLLAANGHDAFLLNAVKNLA